MIRLAGFLIDCMYLVRMLINSGRLLLSLARSNTTSSLVFEVIKEINFQMLSLAIC